MNQNNKEKSNKCNCERGLCCFGKPSTEKCKCPPLQQEKGEDRCKHGIDGTDCFECYPTKKEEVMSADKGEGKLHYKAFKQACSKCYLGDASVDLCACHYAKEICPCHTPLKEEPKKLPSERITEIFKERCKKYGKDEVGWTSGIIFIEAILEYLDEQSKLSTKI